jgi:molybdenum cofactor guanylyltransferase
MLESIGRNDWSLAVLLGGKGRRLGGVAKGNLRLEGQTLLERMLSLAPHFAEVLLVGEDGGAYPAAKGRRVADWMDGAGAPAGLVSAISAAATPWVLVVTCDMPHVSLAAATALARAVGEHDAACFHDGALQPFPGLFRAALADPLRAKFQRGTSVHALLSSMKLAKVPLPDAPWAKLAVRSVNTWDDARALGVVAGD